MEPRKSNTLPSSPTHSSSSSDFEFTVSLSPRKSSTTNLRPADELFYKGQLLPLHLSPRISMVRNLLLPSNTTTARHSSDSHSSFSTDASDSSRPSSATDDDIQLPPKIFAFSSQNQTFLSTQRKKPAGKHFSLDRFSSVFRKETKTAAATRADPGTITGSSVKRMSVAAKEKIRKYLKKVKPLYEKLSPRQVQKTSLPPMAKREELKTSFRGEEDDVASHSFSGNLRFPRRRSCVSSCPSSMRSSPNHSGVLCRKSVVRGRNGYTNNSSSMEELQNAIQGAIAHCKNSMTQTARNHT